MSNTNQINFRNIRQKVLFDHELSGQISDGHWENTANTDWPIWCKVTTTVIPSNVGVNFTCRKHNFNFTDKDLLEVVGTRMKNFVKVALLAEIFGDAQQTSVLIELVNIEGEVEMPTYEGSYWDSKRIQITEALEKIGSSLEKFKHAVSVMVYTDDNLREDLNDMKTIIRTQVQPTAVAA